MVVTRSLGDDAVRSSIMLCSANPVAPTSSDVLQTLSVLFIALAVVAVSVTLVLLRSAKRRLRLTTEAVAPADEVNAAAEREGR